MGMTLDELRSKYNVAYRIVHRERAMRERFFPHGNEKREEKLREMDRLLEILGELKDELKERMEASPEQPRLLDVPRRASYE